MINWLILGLHKKTNLKNFAQVFQALVYGRSKFTHMKIIKEAMVKILPLNTF